MMCAVHAHCDSSNTVALLLRGAVSGDAPHAIWPLPHPVAGQRGKGTEVGTPPEYVEIHGKTVGLAPACFSLCRWQWLKPQVCIQRLSENVLCQRKNRQTLFSSAVLPGGLKADPGLSVGPAGYPAAPTALEQSDPRRGGESPKLPTRVGSPARGPHI